MQESFECKSPFLAYYIATYAHCVRDVPFPDTPCHEVISIAFLQVDEFGEVKMMSSVREKGGGRTEVDLLFPFLCNAERTSFPIVSFQAERFVLPVLKYRAMLHGLTIPRQMWDTKDVMPNYSLNDAFESIGLPERPSLNVKKAYEVGNSIDIRRRLEIDVFSLALLWMRWSIVTGKLSSVEEYLRIALRIIRECRDRSGRMSKFIEKADMGTLLLGDPYDDETHTPRNTGGPRTS